MSKKNKKLLQVRLEPLSMEERNADLWCDVVHDIIHKDIRKICRRYERNERLYMHMIF
jgi:hypothetical protein